jgi:hypothetical protein
MAPHFFAQLIPSLILIISIAVHGSVESAQGSGTSEAQSGLTILMEKQRGIAADVGYLVNSVVLLPSSEQGVAIVDNSMEEIEENVEEGNNGNDNDELSELEALSKSTAALSVEELVSWICYYDGTQQEAILYDKSLPELRRLLDQVSKGKAIGDDEPTTGNETTSAVEHNPDDLPSHPPTRPATPSDSYWSDWSWSEAVRRLVAHVWRPSSAPPISSTTAPVLTTDSAAMPPAKADNSQQAEEPKSHNVPQRKGLNSSPRMTAADNGLELKDDQEQYESITGEQAEIDEVDDELEAQMEKADAHSVQAMDNDVL